MFKKYNYEYEDAKYKINKFKSDNKIAEILNKIENNFQQAYKGEIVSLEDKEL